MSVRVAEARKWAAWIRAVRAEIADRKEAGHIDPDPAAPQPVYEALLEILAAIDALPDDVDCAAFALPDRQRLCAFAAHLARLRDTFARWVNWGLLSAGPSEPAQRFQPQLLRRAREIAAHYP